MAERGSIVMDIRAQVSGYEQSLRKLQAEFAKVDPGSQIGKSLARAIQTAETQLKALNKNLTPRVTSDTQIDNTVQKVNNLGDAIQNVSNLMRQVTTDDINFSVANTSIEELTARINTLEATLNGNITEGFMNAIQNSQALSQAFSDLGLELEGKTEVEIFDQVIKKSQEAAQNVALAEKEVANAKKQLAASKETVTKLEQNPIYNKDVVTQELSQMTQDYTSAIEFIREQVQSGLNQLFQNDPQTQQHLLEAFMGGLTPETLEEHLLTLKNTISDELQGALKPSQIYETLFGGYVGKANNSTAIASVLRTLFPSQEQMTQLQQEFFEKFQTISTALTTNQIKQIQPLISQGDISTALELTLRYIEDAYKTLQAKMLKARQGVLNSEGAVTNAEGQLQQAKYDEAHISTIINTLQAKLDQVSQDNQLLQDEINRLRDERTNQKERTASDIRNNAGSLGSIAREFELSSNEIQKYKDQLSQVHEKEQLVGKIEGVVQRWFSIYAAVRMVGNAIRSVISTLKELDATITEIAIVTNMTQKDLWNQMSDYTAMAQKYAASISGVYKVSQLYYQQGLQTKEVMELTEQTLKMARISGLDYAEATDYMTNAIRSFKMEMTDAQRVVDVYSAIAAKSATNVTELAEAMSKTASSAESVGSSFENTTAMMAVMIEATRESATNIGSAMKSIISRYGEMKADPSKTVDSEGEEMSLNKVDKALQSVGISIHDVNGQFRDFDDVIMELAESWDTIDKNTQRYIATVMAGNRQQSRFLALVSSYDRLKELSAEAANAEDASQLQFLKTLDSIAAKTQQLQTSLQNLYVDSGLERFYGFLIDAGKSIVDTFNNMPKLFDLPILAIGKFGVAFWGIARIVTAVAKSIRTKLLTESKVIENNITIVTLQEENKRLQAQLDNNKTLIKNAQDTTQALNDEEKKRTEAAINENNKKIAALQGTNEILNSESKGNLGWRARLGDSIGKAFSKEGHYMGQTMLGLGLSSIGSSIASGSNQGSAGAVTGGLMSIAGSSLSGFAMGGPWGAAIGGVIGLIQNIPNMIVTAQERLNQLEEEAEQKNNEAIKARSEANTFNQQLEQIRKLEKARYDNAEAEEEYYEAANRMAETYPELIKNLDDVGNATIDTVQAEKKLKDIRAESTQAANDAAVAEYNAQKERERQALEEANAAVNIPQMSEDTGTRSMIMSGLIENKGAGVMSTWFQNNPDMTGLYTMIRDGRIEYQQALDEFYDISDEYNFTSIQQQKFIGYVLDSYKRYSELPWEDLIHEYEQTNISNANSSEQKYLQEQEKTSQVLFNNFVKSINSSLIGVEENYLEDIPDVVGIMAKAAQQKFTDSGYTDLKAFLSDVLPELENTYTEFWENFYENLGTDEIRSNFVQLFKSNKKISRNEMKEQLQAWFKKDDNDIDEIEKAMIDSTILYYYDNSYDKEKFLNRYNPLEGREVSELANTITEYHEELYDNLGSSELQAINTFYDYLENNLESKGGSFTVETAQGVLQNYLDIANKLSEIESLDLKEQAEAIFYSWDGTLTGLYEIQEKLSELGIDLSDNDNFNQLKSNLPVNLVTEFDSLTSKLSSGMEDFEKALSSAAKGMDYNEASKLAIKMGESLDSFTFRDGKYFFKKAENIRNAYIKYSSDLLEELTDGILKQAKSEGINTDNIEELLTYDGNISDELKAELESYKEFMRLSDEYVEYQINAWGIQNGQLREVLKKLLPNKDETDIDALVKAAISGDFSGFTGEASSYINIVKDTVKDITSEIFSAATESIKTGHSISIKVTDTNKDILDKLKEQNFVEYNEDSSTALIQVTKDNIDNYIQFIRQLVQNPTEQAQYIQQAWSAIYDGSAADAFIEFTSSSTITLEAAQQFVIALTGNLDSFNELMETWGYKLNEYTGKFEFIGESADKLREELEKVTDIKQRNKIEQQIAELEHQPVKDKFSSAKDIFSNYESVTEDQIKAYADARKVDFEKIEASFEYDKDTGTYKISLEKLQNLIQDSTGKAREALEELYAGIADDYLDALSTAVSYATQGTTKQADMRKFVNDYKEVVGKEISLDKAFNWNDTLQAFILDSEVLNEYIEKQKQNIKDEFGTDAAEKWLTGQIKQYQNAIDVSGYLSSDRTTQDREQLKEQIKAAFILQSKEYDDTLINRIEKGGEDAIIALKEIKPEASSEEIQNVYRAVVDDQLNALDAISSLTAGQIIATNGELYKALKTLDMVDDNGVIKDTFNMVAAYTQIYETMKVTAGKTQSDLNKAYAYVLTAGEQQEIDAIEAMSNAMGMTYYQLGELLGKYGKDLEDFIANQATNLDIQRIGNGKVRFNNFDAFAEYMNWEYGSEEYLSAFKAYNDSLIELNRQTEKSILEEVKNIISANRGDKVNLTYLIDTLGAGAEQILNEQLKEYGASIKNGILTISESADLISISQTIQNAAEDSGKLMEEELAEITDSITEAINNYSELLIKGITGNLTNVDLQKLMKDSGLQSVTYEKTADGLRLTQEYLIRLYSAMDAGVNKIKVFDELNKYLQENNEHYKTAGANLARISELNKLRTEEAKKLLDTSDAISKADKQISQNRLKQYSQELAVAEKIAAVRATTEDSSYSFMDQSMPGGFQNPINYWESWGKAMKSIQEAGENGYIGIQDYYNMITHIQDLAVQTGKDMKFMGMTISQDGTSAAELIERGFKAMTLDVESGNTVLSLDKLSAELGEIGFDFKAGAEGFDENIQDGIHKFAQSQVDMLDSMIKFVETIVAMEKLGDLDIKGDGIDFSDIFSKSFYDPGKGVTWNYTEQYQEVAQTLLESGKDLEGITVAGYTLKQILEDAKDGIKDITIENDDLVALLQALYSTSISQNYNLSDIYNSILETFQTNGISGELSLGQSKIYVDAPSGVILEFSDKNNHWFYNGKDLGDDPQEALKQALAMRAEESENFDVEVPEAIKVGDKTVEQPIHNTFVLSVNQVDAYAGSANVEFVEEPEKPGAIDVLNAVAKNTNVIDAGTPVQGWTDTLTIDEAIALINAKCSTLQIGKADGFTATLIQTLANSLANGTDLVPIEKIQAATKILTVLSTGGVDAGTALATLLAIWPFIDFPTVASTTEELNVTQTDSTKYTGKTPSTNVGLVTGTASQITLSFDTNDKTVTVCDNNNKQIAVFPLGATSGTGSLPGKNITLTYDGDDGSVRLISTDAEGSQQEITITKEGLIAFGSGELDGANVTLEYKNNSDAIEIKQGDKVLASIPVTGLEGDGYGTLILAKFHYDQKTGNYYLVNGAGRKLFEVPFTGISAIGTGNVRRVEATYDPTTGTVIIQLGEGVSGITGELTQEQQSNMTATGSINSSNLDITYTGDGSFEVTYEGITWSFNPPPLDAIKANGSVTKDNLTWTYHKVGHLNNGAEFVEVNGLDGQTWLFVVNSNNISSNPYVYAKNITPKYQPGTDKNENGEEKVNNPDTSDITWGFDVNGNFSGHGSFDGTDITVTCSETGTQITLTEDVSLGGKTIGFNLSNVNYQGSGTVTDDNTNYSLHYEDILDENGNIIGKQYQVTGIDGKTFTFSIPDSATYTGTATITDDNVDYKVTYTVTSNGATHVQIVDANGNPLPGGECEFDLPDNNTYTGTGTTSTLNYSVTYSAAADGSGIKVEVTGLPTGPLSFTVPTGQSLDVKGDMTGLQAEYKDGENGTQVTVEKLPTNPIAPTNANTATINIALNAGTATVTVPNNIEFDFSEYEPSEEDIQAGWENFNISQKLQYLIDKKVGEETVTLTLKDFLLNLPTDNNGEYRVELGSTGDVKVYRGDQEVTADIAAKVKDDPLTPPEGWVLNDQNHYELNDIIVDIVTQLLNPDNIDSIINGLTTAFIKNPIIITTKFDYSSALSETGYNDLSEAEKYALGAGNHYGLGTNDIGGFKTLYWGRGSEDYLPGTENNSTINGHKNARIGYIQTLQKDLEKAQEEVETGVRNYSYAELELIDYLYKTYSRDETNLTDEDRHLWDVVKNITSSMKLAKQAAEESEQSLEVIPDFLSQLLDKDLISLNELLSSMVTLVSTLPDTKEITITAIDKATSPIQEIIDKLSELKNVLSTLSSNFSVTTSESSSEAKGNVALSKGTLMGELGPELYVTNGRYFVAGQNGAEFVNLPKDAIVFNHLQTQRLLSNGSSGRGKPITNEKNAVSYAKGNGPAMASASSVLATLKHLRSQWQSLLTLSVSDLAGKGGGGGGGGQEDLPGFIRDVERWYNWLQKIADLEKQINYEETLRSKIQSDMVSNGKAYYASQKRQLDQLRDSTITSSSLYLSQLDYFNQRREQLNNNSPLSELYTFDTTGQLHYQPGSYQWLAQLFKTNDYGQLELTPQQQYEMIMKRNPQFAQYMKYNSEGKEIKASDYEDQAQYYLDMVKAFSDRMDSEKEEMQSLFDSINEQGNAVNEKLQKQNELIQAMRDNQKEVEESVLDAIVESREREIKEIQDTKDALQKSNEDFINGLSDQLEKERKLYDNNQNDEELNRSRRQLAILQRSGGSAAQIASLQKQIEEQSRDQYFEKQQEQIDAVREASDLQIERLDRQIELMNETLEYQKANGLLWGQVYEVMAGTPQQISDFIMQNTAAEWAKSPLSSTEAANNWIFKTEQWVSFRDDIEGIYDALTATWNLFDEEMGQMFGDIWSGADQEAIKKIFNAKYAETGDYNAAAEAVMQSDIYKGMKNKLDAQTAKNTQLVNIPNNNNNNSQSNAIYKWNVAKDGKLLKYGFNTKAEAEAYRDTLIKREAAILTENYEERNIDGKISPALLKQIAKSYIVDAYQYKNGGLIDFTGPAWVDGTKQRPESIWDAETTKLMKDNLLNSRNLNLLSTFWDTLQDYQTATNHSYSNNSESLVIENAVVNMNVASIANDYDARRAGEQAMEEMLRIARKTRVSNF